MYLMDTHAYLWFLNDDPQLPSKTRELMRRTENLCISIGSFWEMAIKANLGKLTLPASISELMADCNAMRIDILPIASKHLECLMQMPNYHGDPFDRLILSQAMAEHMTIITKDGKFAQYGVKTCWE